ncbi:MAG: hypothetical protein GXO07_01315 [Crenarchaeota archaeon]|nr:hypothetical protein [Thermoproteota archaeon]
MDVWEGLEQAKASLDAKIAGLERVRDRIPYVGAKAINLANVYTYMIDVLERIKSVVECLSNAKDTSAVVGGKGMIRVKDTNWFVQVEGDSVVLKRVNPSLTIAISPEAVRIATRTKEDKEIKKEAVLGNSEFKMRRDKVEVAGRYGDYDYVLDNAYYVRTAFKEVAREVMKKGEPLIAHLKTFNVTC